MAPRHSLSQDRTNPSVRPGPVLAVQATGGLYSDKTNVAFDDFKARGGNDIKVEFFHDRTNLHRVWDSGLIRHTKKPWTTYAAELQATMTPEQAAEWETVTSPGDWATETYELAVTYAYEIPTNGQLGQPYFDRCIPVVEKRLTMAGVRLAHLLNTVFAEE